MTIAVAHKWEFHQLRLQVEIHLAEAGVSIDEALLRAKFKAGKDY